MEPVRIRGANFQPRVSRSTPPGAAEAVDTHDTIRGLQDNGVQFRCHKSFLFRPTASWKDASADQAARLIADGKPQQLEARRPGLDWLPVTDRNDLRVLHAMYGKTAPGALTHPALAQALYRMEAAGTPMQATRGAGVCNVGAYGAYQMLHQAPHDMGSLRLDSQGVQTAEDALLVACMSGQADPASLTCPALAESLKVLHQHGYGLATGDLVESYYKLLAPDPPATVQITHQKAVLAEVPSSALQDASSLQSRLQRDRTHYDATAAALGDQAPAAWEALRQDGSTRPFEERLHLMSRLSEHGAPRKLYDGIVGTSADLKQAAEDAAMMQQALPSDHQEEALGGLQVLQSDLGHKPEIVAQARAAAVAWAPLRAAMAQAPPLVAEQTDRAAAFAGCMQMDDAGRHLLAQLATSEAAPQDRGRQACVLAQTLAMPATAGQRTQSLRRLESLTAEVGAPTAYKLWPSLLPHCGGADYDESKKMVVQLAERCGASTAAVAWQSMGVLPPHQRDESLQLLTRLETTMKDKTQAAMVWAELIPFQSEPDFEDRATALTGLINRIGMENAEKVWPLLDDGSPGSRRERLELLDLSQHMVKAASSFSRLEDAVDIYQSLAGAHLGVEERHALRTLSDNMGTWQAEGEWRRHQHGTETVWTNIPQKTGDKVTVPGFLGMTEPIDRSVLDSNRNHANCLTSQPLPLTGLSHSMLRFDEGHWFRSNGSGCTLEVSDNGQDWEPLMEYHGQKATGPQFVDLSAYDGKTVQIRFNGKIEAVAGDGNWRGQNCGGVQVSNFVIEGMDAGRGKPSGIPVEAFMRFQTLQDLVRMASEKSARQNLHVMGSLASLPPEVGQRVMAFIQQHKNSLTADDVPAFVTRVAAGFTLTDDLEALLNRALTAESKNQKLEVTDKEIILAGVRVRRNVTPSNA